MLDPQGKAIEGWPSPRSALMAWRVFARGKVFDVELQGSKKDAEKKLADMCEKLLANTVIENYSVEIVG